ncbi:unnamed protein product, partial [marine sediment metagenome]
KKINEPMIVTTKMPARILLSYPASPYTPPRTASPTAAAIKVIKNVMYKKNVAKWT